MQKEQKRLVEGKKEDGRDERVRDFCDLEAKTKAERAKGKGL